MFLIMLAAKNRKKSLQRQNSDDNRNKNEGFLSHSLRRNDVMRLLLSTDKGILKYKSDTVKLLNPIEFIDLLNGGNENGE